MIDDAEFNSLGDMVEASIMGARPVEEVQVELLWAILKEVRSMRMLAKQTGDAGMASFFGSLGASENFPGDKA